ncbi:unnamed protein product [Hydatigera taeniaeformis]|uniref:Transporter n=1 Tax=Hydatigena taeniaeformis TaxID=6205 RepID=A0A3P7EQX1_HYDTA|nr:unnamed protein product [Hydatigera taeniaeformis]
MPTFPCSEEYEAASPTSTEPLDWDQPVQFILSLIGYSVGLGSIWRFPYIVMINGGGAFLVPYLIFLLFCGIPFCYMEFTLGQFTGLKDTAPPMSSACNGCDAIAGVGWSMLLVSGVLCIYYNIIMAWVIFYFMHSFQWQLPWISCNNSWNTPTCFSYTQTVVDIVLLRWKMWSGLRCSTLEFWNHRVLEISASIDEVGGVNWNLFGCMLAAWVVTFMCLFKGIKSSGKVVYVSALAPYVFLTVLVIRGVTLPGASIGLQFYLKPHWQQLKSVKVWLAAVQVFYSLGPAWGGLITMSSYNQVMPTHAFFRDAVILSVVCGGTNIFCGLAVFSVTGHMAYQTRSKSVTSLMLTGPGLAFIAYPEALGQIPGAAIWTVLFFAMLFTLGLDSQVKYQLEFAFLFQAGVYFFQIFDWYGTPISISIIATLEVIALSYFYGGRRLFTNAETMLGPRAKLTRIVWVSIWYIVTPCFTFFIFVTIILDYTPPKFNNGQPFPQWATIAGWCLASISLIPIPLLALMETYRNRHNLEERVSRQGTSIEISFLVFSCLDRHESGRRRVNGAV